MFDFSNPETMWLNTTNLVLGAVTLVCVLAFAGVLVKELLQRARKHAASPAFDDHAFVYPDLGITMADGGEKIDEMKIHGDRSTKGSNQDSHTGTRADH